MRTYTYNLTNYIKMGCGQLPFSLLIFISTRQVSHWKVTFSVMCVCQSVCSQRDIPPYKALVDLYLALEALDMLKLIQFGPDCIGTPKTRSNLFIMKLLQLVNGRLGSVWNIFLFFTRPDYLGEWHPRCNTVRMSPKVLWNFHSFLAVILSTYKYIFDFWSFVRLRFQLVTCL